MKKILIVLFLLLSPCTLFSMHIMEGFLPVQWAAAWWGIAICFFYIGLIAIKRRIADKPHLKLILAMAGAFAFLLSSLKIPSVTGSSSHMTGVGLGAILFGPFAMTVLGFIVLLFQALLLAHGGLTTLGANTFSMAVAGPVITYLVYILCRKIRMPVGASVFLSSSIGCLSTYVVTSVQLACAHPSPGGGIFAAMIKFLSVFAVTQIPLAVVEGMLTVVILNILTRYAMSEMQDLGFGLYNGVKVYEK